VTLSTRAKLSITLAAPILGIAIAEIVVRVGGWRALPAPRVQGAVFHDVPDSPLRFVNLPGGEQIIRYERPAPEAPLEIVSRVNAQGFRGPLVDAKKPAGVFRIACVGDSHTFGYGVAEGNTWPDALREALSRLPLSQPCEVMNCGVNAYDTEQEVLFLEQYVLPYEPDLVLLQFYMNDTALRDLPDAPPPEGDFWLELAHPWRRGIVRELRQRSQFIDLVLSNIYRRRHLSQFGRDRVNQYADAAAGWIRCRSAISRASDRLAASNIRFALVLFPFLFEDGGRLASHGPFSTVSAYCAQRGVACFDFESDFLGRDLDALRVHPLDYHTNDAGHRIFGEAVARELDRANLLPRDR
jgi:lysophospholipase L1-like esterase